MFDARNLVNINDYPIHKDGEKRDAVLETVRENLALDGCTALTTARMSILRLMIKRCRRTILGVVSMIGLMHLFLLTIFKPMVRCAQYMILTDSITLYRTVFRKMHFIDMPIPWRM